MGFFDFPAGKLFDIFSANGLRSPLAWAAAGTLFTFGMTALGAALVFFVGSRIGERMQRICLGFAGGVMAAASVFSLLLPAIEQIESAGNEPLAAVSLGFLTGALALFALDAALECLGGARMEDEDARRRALMLTAVTLHNIPEGMAVGLAFAVAAGAGGGAELAAAATLALGVGIQNFPEGAAVSLPVRQSGASRAKSFLAGALSGAVEPVFGVLVVLIAESAQAAMPFLMAAAAGAMTLVVLTELAGEAAKERAGVLAMIAGYVVMMALDIGFS